MRYHGGWVISPVVTKRKRTTPQLPEAPEAGVTA
jgi:hypothetical protein